MSKMIEVKEWVVAVTWITDPGFWSPYERYIGIRYVNAIDKVQAEVTATQMIRNETDGKAEYIVCVADDFETCDCAKAAAKSNNENTPQ